MRFRHMVAAIAVASAAAFGATAIASDLPEKGPNGGQLGESGEHHLELVVSGQTLTVHLLDHDNKTVVEAGVKGTATVAAGGQTEIVSLSDKGKGAYSGTGKFAATGALKVDVTLTPPNEAPLKATFDVKR